jgi:hypothetical protein
MTENNNVDRREDDAALEREILEGRKFTLDEAVARMVGPGAMKGESPVTRLRQAEVEIELWLGSHLGDSGGGLKTVLHRWVSGSEILLSGFDQPLAALADYCEHVLASDYILAELVREADVEWGRTLGERPYFERDGSPCHPEDPYTVESVRRTLGNLLEKLASDSP